MRSALGVTAVCWQTRNRRQQAQAVAQCRNFGLRPLTSTLWIGTLKPGERDGLQQWFRQNLTKKTEQFHFLPLCKSCYENSLLGKIDKAKIGYPQFEIIG